MNPISKLLHNKKGFTQVLVAIIVVIVAVIMIMVAAVVLSLFGTAINNVSGLSAAANTTIASVQTSGFGALQLLTIVVYVLAAVAIIGAVMGIFAYVRMQRE
jgi:Flp pilus assembly pilin Flp